MDVAHRVPEAAILIKVTKKYKFVSFIIEGEVRRGRNHEMSRRTGGLADDGKRLGLFESALDVALPQVL